jgi:hypothetical protein
MTDKATKHFKGVNAIVDILSRKNLMQELEGSLLSSISTTFSFSKIETLYSLNYNPYYIFPLTPDDHQSTI